MCSSKRVALDKGGWIPVLNKQRKIGAKVGNETSIREGKSNGTKPLFTLFVDNLPEDVSQRWVRYLFNKFGVVKDVFIPGKRSKVTGKLFGFVRYDCEVSADMAISKANGLWIEDRKLFVKMAFFDQNKGNNDERQINPNQNLTRKNSNNMETNTRVESLTSGNATASTSYANAVKGVLGGKGTYANAVNDVLGGKGNDKRMQEGSFKGERKLCLKSDGNGWLYRSAVAKLHKLISIEELKAQMARMGVDNIMVRAMGGRSVILTCNNKEEMENLIKVNCLQRWFSEVKPWEGQATCIERFVWLCCYGFPLNGWSNNSFKAIGELWGTFICTDESTLRLTSFAMAKVLVATSVFDEIDEWINIQIEGKNYRVKVMEDPCDQPFKAEKQIPRDSLVSSQQQEDGDSKDEEDDDDLDDYMSNHDTGTDMNGEGNDVNKEATITEVVEDTNQDIEVVVDERNSEKDKNLVSGVSETNGSSFDVELNHAELNTPQRSGFLCENSLAIREVEPNLNEYHLLSS
ncbi:hypothetical protein RHMOL_Rhmol12G0064100 [Rhododendron molle]|uniref:Uncharacterized protein n=1 Tax=Rhododendron molle TaxID=49168 RepID=A0ACC0LFI6_RHOML|nr:hypothetical protein RHMOL_Rhmol12G0064100 [Rhododendron molle]